LGAISQETQRRASFVVERLLHTVELLLRRRRLSSSSHAAIGFVSGPQGVFRGGRFVAADPDVRAFSYETAAIGRAFSRKSEDLVPMASLVVGDAAGEPLVEKRTRSLG
jgi:hypothetical protein